ncbi:MAG: rod shape-determining protein MreC [Oscillospiraceae bacterium]|nr:rod shape-determining protein MreC [Oscillospiraceae bacterium]
MHFNDFLRSNKFRVLLCVIALLTGVMLYSVRQGGHTDVLSRMLYTITYPVRQFSAGISKQVNEKLDTYYHAKAYREENALLREQIALLNKQLIGYEEAMNELGALREQLSLKQKHTDFVMSEPATVLIPLTNDLSDGFMINLGEEDGILLNAPVICAQGLVGVITELSPHYAVVTTILSPELSVGALVLQTGDTGIVEGTLRYAAEDQTKMIYLEEQHSIEQNDLVITAGTTGLFPYGLPIGNVTETAMEETGLTAYAVLEPTVDFSALEAVTVLLDFEGKGVSLP